MNVIERLCKLIMQYITFKNFLSKLVLKYVYSFKIID